MQIDQLIQKAKSSKFNRWKLNFLLQRFIPFNRPHGLQITEISSNKVKVKIPYWKSNQNHLKGIHACCLATAAEYCSGFLLLHRLGMKKYRLIMESMEVKYVYQAKMLSYASFEIDEEDFKNNVLEKLEQEGIVYKKCIIPVNDAEGNLICEATTNWQIKTWSKVKTKVE